MILSVSETNADSLLWAIFITLHFQGISAVRAGDHILVARDDFETLQNLAQQIVEQVAEVEELSADLLMHSIN